MYIVYKVLRCLLIMCHLNFLKRYNIDAQFLKFKAKIRIYNAHRVRQI